MQPDSVAPVAMSRAMTSWYVPVGPSGRAGWSLMMGKPVVEGFGRDEHIAEHDGEVEGVAGQAFGGGLVEGAAPGRQGFAGAGAGAALGLAEAHR